MSASTLTAVEMSHIPAHGRFLFNLLQHIQIGSLDCYTPNGEHFSFSAAEPGPHAVVYIGDWRAVSKIITHGDIGLAEAYRDGWIDSDDWTQLLLLALLNEKILSPLIEGKWWHKLGYWLKHLTRANTLRGSRKNIHAHYDLGNDFYQLWLDSSMSYSAAMYYGNHKTSLTCAQINKYDQILQQLNITQDSHILEIGCGWGGFMEYAIEKTGCRVDGVTLSSEQKAWTEKRLAEKGFADRGKVQLTDYRKIKQQYDHIVSIEMFEAVGEQYWKVYFQKIMECLKPEGKAVIQTITIEDGRFESYRKNTDFIQQYIFPGGMLPSVEKFVAHARLHGFKTSKPILFGQDYAETLRRWQHNFENKLAMVKNLGFDDAFIRLWRFYLAYCEAGFISGRTDVMQITLKKS